MTTEIATNPAAALVMMTVEEARKRVATINVGMNNIRALLLDFFEREGWRALGYGSWRACVVGEFQQSQAYLYRQLEARLVEENVIQISPMGETAEIGKIPERHLRPLASLPTDEQRCVWEEVVRTAPNGKITTKHVQAIVDRQKKSGAAPAPQELAAPSEAFDLAYRTMLQIIIQEKAGGWQKTAKSVAVRHVRALREAILTCEDAP